MAQIIPKLIVCILIICNFLFGIGSYEILHFPQDARSLSLHNSASAYDRSLLRNNPASLSLTSEKIIYSYLILPAGINSGEIQRIRKMTAGISAIKLSYISYGHIVDSKTHKETTAYDILVGIGYKKELENIISIGISGGYLISSIANYYSHLFYTNLGIRSRMMRKRMGVGFSLENVGLLLNSYTDVKESIPTIFRSSIYYKPKYLPSIISIDIIRDLNRNSTKLSCGLEFNPGKRLTFRLGFSSYRADFITGDFSSDLLIDVSGGVGFQFNQMNLDVGFMNLGAAGYVMGFSISRKVD